ncbi:rho guanine nucleotide exchange factor 2 isoform X2 [Tyto alba]|uniref:rho guanine nucleotide exchange factor 2 isoform X2 n=1 Tax=Tyto alba TaxID=56313 RepID=UPI001C675BB2|nr:rho guanine nucleotide exchange factor 2 isoform X2 [Tyto alba]
MDGPDIFLGPCEGALCGVPAQKRRCMSALEPVTAPSPSPEAGWEEEGEEDEDEGRFRGVPMRRSCALRTSIRSRDPFRRHSWEPGKELQGVPGYDQLSVSLKGLSPDDIDSSTEQLDGLGQHRRDPRRAPLVHSNDDLESLLSQDEEDEADVQRAQEDARRLPAYRARQSAGGCALSKSASLSIIDSFPDADEISPFTSQQSLVNGFGAGSCGQLAGEAGSQSWEETPLGRTLSFIKRMTGKTKSKEKEKEKMKEGKDKDARYTNGHLFTTITVSGMTMCFACNKSITAKEALICPTCNVTIHNRCKDTLPNCTKVKQKQQKAALLKNSSALQSVSLRNKTAIRERPNSAIYPSESFRQTLLGPRRGRPSLSLSKSVSTTNIAGTFNDESPLGIRRILSQSTDSLNMRNRTLSVESLIDEGPDVILNQLMSDFETDGKDFEADSWSLAVDNSYLQQHKMDVMKRQDVIYELIQTEIHHVRTLKIMATMFRKAMLEELQVDPGTVQKIFPCVDELSQIHERFLAQLLERRRESLAHDSNKNFVINRLGDILVNQFSGASAEQLKKAYSEFCSKHTKAVKEYKDLLARDKRFQQFIRRMTRSPLLRRHGVPECILLVTQRITKYPVLIERILKNSKDNEGDSADLSRALKLVKELISAINEEVHTCEMNARLWDVYRRVDGRAKVQLPWESRAGVFGKDELLRRKLVHSGCMLWKTAAGRFKDVLVLLMTDVLIFLQEKDQKYTFPMLDKPAVISLQNLIVRDIANQEKGMFLISAAPPEMYEVHAASRDDRNNWMKVIQQTVSLCPSRQDFPLIETEIEASLRKLKDRILQHDRKITALLEEKVGLFADMLALASGCEETSPTLAPRSLFHSDSAEGARGEKLMHDAIREVECLKEIFTGAGRDRDQNNLAEAESCPSPSTSNGDAGSFNGSLEFCRADSDAGQRDGNGNQLLQRVPQEEINQRLVNLYSLLHGLQAALSQRDTLLELQRQEGPEQPPARGGSAGPPPSEAASELALLQRQHALVQEELGRCRQLCQERAQEAAALEARLRDSEQQRARLERELREARRQDGGARGRRGGDPRRRSLPAGDALYLSFTPPQLSHGPHPASLSYHHPAFAPCPRDQLDYRGADPDRLREGDDPLDALLEDEALGSHHSPPASPRDFLRMQDIPEEVESSQELKEGDGGSSDS